MKDVLDSLNLNHWRTDVQFISFTQNKTTTATNP